MDTVRRNRMLPSFLFQRSYEVAFELAHQWSSCTLRRLKYGMSDNTLLDMRVLEVGDAFVPKGRGRLAKPTVHEALLLAEFDVDDPVLFGAATAATALRYCRSSSRRWRPDCVALGVNGEF